MPKFRVLVTDYYFENLDNEKRVLAEIGAEVVGGDFRTEEDVIQNAQGFDALLVETAPITRRVFEALPQVKAVGRYGIGYDVIDVKAATDHGVYVVNVPDYCYDEVSEHTLALLLAAVRKVNQLDVHVKSGNWEYNPFKPIYRLAGSTLGLIGFGKIARAISKKAKVLGLKIITSDPFLEKSVADKYGVELATLEEVLQNADYISLHVPLTEKTKHLIGEKELSLMKKTAIVVNTARGAMIDEKALVSALQKNEIAGAALDVLENEPVEKTNPLLEMPNVIITPHIAYYSEESLAQLQSMLARGVADALIGKVPKNLVNREVL